jgi:hypothetical protein
MKDFTFAETYKKIDDMDTHNIVLNEKSIRQVSKVEKEMHSSVEVATQGIIKGT